ncbi:MAG: NTP transferase domain-containing protein [Proteobacteria bacterium]|nr:NTP transferase domain-containing protein [Pseudomonadota bacterium]
MPLPEEDMKDVCPVILAGGQGRRLRPLTGCRPKPFLRLRSRYTLLQETAMRVRGMKDPSVVSLAGFRERIVADMAAAGIRTDQIFLEPAGKNTAPAAAAASHYFAARDPDSLLLVMPSDHAIENSDAFLRAVGKGLPLAKRGKLVLFGIRPDRADTAYGYIRRGNNLHEEAYECAAFIEKPGRAIARRLLREGDCYWNSGIFLFRAGDFLKALRKNNSLLYDKSLASVMRARRIQNAVFLDSESFSSCPCESVDRAVMEKADNLCVISVDMGWRDLGSWREIVRHVLRMA